MFCCCYIHRVYLFSQFVVDSEPEGKSAKRKPGEKKIQGFDRGLTPEKIIGATDTSGKRLYFFISMQTRVVSRSRGG